MSLLNPPELRPSQIVMLVQHLSAKRGRRDKVERLYATMGPPRGESDVRITEDLEENLKAAEMLNFVMIDGDDVVLGDEVAKVASKGVEAIADALRESVFDIELNTAAWCKQTGARDLTNALAWFLTLSLEDAPQTMDGEGAASEVLLRDFGPRQGSEDEGTWPIMNGTRWTSFMRWAVSLGFAWRVPAGRSAVLVPDPSLAVRNVLATVFDSDRDLPAELFFERLATALPVLDSGVYRTFVTDHWNRPSENEPAITGALSLALKRLDAEGVITLDSRPDAARKHLSNGLLLSNVTYRG